MYLNLSYWNPHSPLGDRPENRKLQRSREVVNRGFCPVLWRARRKNQMPDMWELGDTFGVWQSYPFSQYRELKDYPTGLSIFAWGAKFWKGWKLPFTFPFDVQHCLKNSDDVDGTDWRQSREGHQNVTVMEGWLGWRQSICQTKDEACVRGWTKVSPSEH